MPECWAYFDKKAVKIKAQSLGKYSCFVALSSANKTPVISWQVGLIFSSLYLKICIFPLFVHSCFYVTKETEVIT